MRASSQPSAPPGAAPDTGFAALMQRQAGQRALAMGGRGERPPLAIGQIDRQIERPAERPAEAPGPVRTEAPPRPGPTHARSAAGPARPAAPANTRSDTRPDTLPDTPPDALAQRASPAQARRTALAHALNNGLARARSASAASPAAGLAASRAPGAADAADSTLSAIQREPTAATPAADNALPAPVPTATSGLAQAAPPPATPGSGAPAQGSGPRSTSVAAVDGNSQPGPGITSGTPGVCGPGSTAPTPADANNRPIAAPNIRRDPPGALAAPGADAGAARTAALSDSATGLLGAAPGAMHTLANAGPRSSPALGTPGAALPAAPAPDRPAGAPAPQPGLPAGSTAQIATGLPATAADVASKPALSAVHAPQDARSDAPTDAPHNAPNNAAAMPAASPAAGAGPITATQPAGANPPPWLGRDRPPSGVGHNKAGAAHERLEPVPLNGGVSSASAATPKIEPGIEPSPEPEPASGRRPAPATDPAAGQPALEPARTRAARPATQEGPTAWHALAMVAPLALSSAPASAPAGAVGPPAAPVEARIAVPLNSPVFAPALGAQVSLFAQDGVQTARLLLNPAEMGPVSVQIVIDGNAARVDFQADRAATRDVIEASLPALASALQDAGLTLTGGGVSQQPPRQQSPAPPAPPVPALAAISQNPADRDTGVAQAGQPLRTRGVVDLVA